MKKENDKYKYLTTVPPYMKEPVLQALIQGVSMEDLSKQFREDKVTLPGGIPVGPVDLVGMVKYHPLYRQRVKDKVMSIQETVDKQYLSAKELAEIAGVSVGHIHKRCKAKKIPYIKSDKGLRLYSKAAYLNLKGYRKKRPTSKRRAKVTPVKSQKPSKQEPHKEEKTPTPKEWKSPRKEDLVLLRDFIDFLIKSSS